MKRSRTTSVGAPGTVSGAAVTVPEKSVLLANCACHVTSPTRSEGTSSVSVRRPVASMPGDGSQAASGASGLDPAAYSVKLVISYKSGSASAALSAPPHGGRAAGPKSNADWPNTLTRSWQFWTVRARAPAAC
jgi:hypothetical protein